MPRQVNQLFVITGQARQYINRKGKHILIYLETFLTCNRSCQAPQGIDRRPVVRLGRPQPDEMEFYTPVELDGITLWYNSDEIIQDEPGQPIRIAVKKSLFIYDLVLEGVKQHP